MKKVKLIILILTILCLLLCACNAQKTVDSFRIDDNGHLIVNWTDGTSEDLGVPKNGENGENGQTPFIGDNGNWWIGNVDTGISAVATLTNCLYTATTANVEKWSADEKTFSSDTVEKRFTLQNDGTFLFGESMTTSATITSTPCPTAKAFCLGGVAGIFYDGGYAFFDATTFARLKANTSDAKQYLSAANDERLTLSARDDWTFSYLLETKNTDVFQEQESGVALFFDGQALLFKDGTTWRDAISVVTLNATTLTKVETKTLSVWTETAELEEIVYSSIYDVEKHDCYDAVTSQTKSLTFSTANGVVSIAEKTVTENGIANVEEDYVKEIYGRHAKTSWTLENGVLTLAVYTSKTQVVSGKFETQTSIADKQTYAAKFTDGEYILSDGTKTQSCDVTKAQQDGNLEGFLASPLDSKVFALSLTTDAVVWSSDDDIALSLFTSDGAFCVCSLSSSGKTALGIEKGNYLLKVTSKKGEIKNFALTKETARLCHAETTAENADSAYSISTKYFLTASGCYKFMSTTQTLQVANPVFALFGNSLCGFYSNEQLWFFANATYTFAGNVPSSDAPTANDYPSAFSATTTQDNVSTTYAFGEQNGVKTFSVNVLTNTLSMPEKTGDNTISDGGLALVLNEDDSVSVDATKATAFVADQQFMLFGSVLLALDVEKTAYSLSISGTAQPYVAVIAANGALLAEGGDGNAESIVFAPTGDKVYVLLVGNGDVTLTLD